MFGKKENNGEISPDVMAFKNTLEEVRFSSDV